MKSHAKCISLFLDFPVTWMGAGGVGGSGRFLPTHAAEGCVRQGAFAVLAFDVGFYSCEEGFQTGGARVGFLASYDGIGLGWGGGGHGLVQLTEGGQVGGEGAREIFASGGA